MRLRKILQVLMVYALLCVLCSIILINVLPGSGKDMKSILNQQIYSNDELQTQKSPFRDKEINAKATENGKMFLIVTQSINTNTHQQFRGNKNVKSDNTNHLLLVNDLKKNDLILHANKVNGKSMKTESNVTGVSTRPSTINFTSLKKSQMQLLSSTSQSERKPDSACPVLQLKHRVLVDFETETNCRKRNRSETGCKYAADTYKYNYAEHSCQDEPLSICRVERNKLQCTYQACWKNENTSAIFIFIFNTSNGQVNRFAKCYTQLELTSKANKYAKITKSNGHHFMFFSCDQDQRRTQLLLLNQISLKAKQERTTSSKAHRQNNKKTKRDKTKDNLSINIVILDSVSRAHFYRSLRKTIATFNTINTGNSGAEVLDFEFFQALHGHSPENNHALNTGTMFPDRFSDEQIHDAGTGIDILIKMFREKGYDVLYQDDMCWRAKWGLWLEIGGPDGWENFTRKVREMNITDTGLTFASCKLLDLHHTDDMFNSDVNETFCYNGYQQDAYYLEYIQNTFMKNYFSLSAEKLFSFANLMVGHDYGGVRIQSIDGDLARFVNIFSRMENTFTIVLADHGNTYTEYVFRDIEGRYEMFNPSLFVVVPKRVQQILGNSVMSALRTNQRRLLTMLDVHQMLIALGTLTANSHHEVKFADGMLVALPTNRSCSDIPLKLPNMCVCHGWTTPLTNTTVLLGLLEFSVGQLNNIISKVTKGICKLLVPIKFQNVFQRKRGDDIITKLDIYTEAGLGSKNVEDIFNVEIKSVISGTVDSYEMELLSNERISQFGQYRRCRGDHLKSFRLCICDMQARRRAGDKDDVIKHLHSRTSRKYKLFQKANINIVEETNQISAHRELYILTRSYFEQKDIRYLDKFMIAVTFEVINLSRVNQYAVEINFINMDNMKRLTKRCKLKVEPSQFLYICTIERVISSWRSNYNFTTVVQKMNEF